MLWEKGIREYAAAAKELKSRYSQVEFRLLGPVDDNPSAIPREQLEQWAQDGVEYLGETDDVRPYLEQATVFVLSADELTQWGSPSERRWMISTSG